MNFTKFTTSRVAVCVTKDDYKRFAQLCDEYGFCDLFGLTLKDNMYPFEGEQGMVCFAHGYHGRPLDKHLSHGSLSTYLAHNFSVVYFEDFDEYIDDENEKLAEPIPMEALMLLIE